jgi:hypothetical protein
MKERQEISLSIDEHEQPKEIAAVQAEINTEHSKLDQIEVGDWFWVLNEFDSRGNKLDNPDWWFCCVIKVGSNFVQFKSPHGGTERVHFDKLHTHTRRENNAVAYINQQVEKNKSEVQHWINEAREVTKRLGVRDHLRLGQDVQAESGTTLATCSGIVDTKAYKNALIEAKKIELPAIFEKIRKSTEELTVWMKADSIYLKAVADGLKSSIELIDSRIFTVTLYSGISEEVAHVQSGKPAGFDERLHVMQRRHYMDEESLLNYEHGGMTFSELKQFDEWLCRKDNFDRLFPFPRCMVSFRCRRYMKKRDAFNIEDHFVNIRLEEYDKFTFLYIRNGENLYRMNCDLEFGHLMFGQNQSFDFAEPMMVHIDGGKVSEVISKRHFEQKVEEFKTEISEYEANHKLRQAWLKEHGALWNEIDERYEERYTDDLEKDRNKKPPRERCPYPWKSEPSNDPRDKYQLFDGNNVYFDEATKYVKDQIDQYNRIALIIQGIFDRSEMLHPHAPVKMWDGHNFNQSVKLVYDGTATIYDGDPPDFNAYVAECNKTIGIGSIVIGQEYFWAKAEAVKENNRMARHGYGNANYREHKTYHPYGNHGPGKVAIISEVQKRKKAAVFRWSRARQSYSRWGDNSPIPTHISVPFNQLFNVSAYKLGDYKKFFNDPRTREDYGLWAGTLLLAEEIAAGNYNVKLNEMQKHVDKMTADGYERNSDGSWERKRLTKSKLIEDHVSKEGCESQSIEYIGDDEDEELEKKADEEE